MAKSIKSKLIESLHQKHACFVTDVVCWEYHGKPITSSNSNLMKTIQKLPKLAEDYRYLVVVGALNFNKQHATKLHVFRVSKDNNITAEDCLWRNFWFIPYGKKSTDYLPVCYLVSKTGVVALTTQLLPEGTLVQASAHVVFCSQTNTMRLDNPIFLVTSHQAKYRQSLCRVWAKPIAAKQFLIG